MRGSRPLDEEIHAGSSLAEEAKAAEEHVSFADRWVLPYVEDSALWPVLIVVIAHVVVFIAPLLLYSVRDGHLLSVGVLAWLIFMSAQVVRDEVKRIGRFGTLGWLLVVTWLLSGIAAFYGARWDII